MKTKLISLVLLSLLLTTGCSVDSIEEPIIEIGKIDEKAAIFDNNFGFSFREYGEFELVDPKYCTDLDQVMMKGSGKSESFPDSFLSSMTLCTDFSTNNKIEGYIKMGNGDQLFYYVDESGSDAKGRWFIYVYKGGTGQFSKAHGKAMVYTDMQFKTSVHGIYKSSGEGYLKY